MIETHLTEETPGRSCPVSYRYGPEALRGTPQLQSDTLWIAGGLYGNTLALHALLEAYAADRGDKALLFNGDFHWFDVDPADFRLVNETVLALRGIRGNVETELAAPGVGAGCGCAYPDWAADATVLLGSDCPRAELPRHQALRAGLAAQPAA